MPARKYLIMLFLIFFAFIGGHSNYASAESWEYIGTTSNGIDGYFDWDSAWYSTESNQGGTLMKGAWPNGSFIVIAHLDYNQWRVIIQDLKSYDKNGRLIGEDTNWSREGYAEEGSNSRRMMIKIRSRFIN